MIKLDPEYIQLKEFQHVITNINWESQSSRLTKRYKKEWVKYQEEQKIYAEKQDNNKLAPVIYSIKDMTDGKTEIEIIEIIRSELGIEEDESFQWNKMIYAISHFNLNSDAKSKGEKIL